MNFETIRGKALDRVPLTFDEALWLYETVPPARLFRLADALRRNAVEEPGTVTWQIDRNVNITNVCISGCKFCNFHCRPGERTAYITTPEAYDAKIEETLRLGGDQLLLQGGLHPPPRHRLLRRALPRPQGPPSGNPAPCPRCPGGRPHRPYQLPLDRRDAATAARGRARFAARRRRGDSLRRSAPPHLTRQTLRRAMVRSDARSPPDEPAHLGYHDVRPCGDTRPAHRTPVAAARPAGRMPGGPLRFHRLHPVDILQRGYPARKGGGYVPASPRSNTCVSSPSAASYSTTYATYRLRGSPSARPRHR